MRQLNTTPVPNIILDCYLKELNATELKVLFVVIRQTLGWADRRGMFGRKDVDWISGSQLRQKTGCSKRAISSAIDLLCQMHVIEVLDEYRNILNNPNQRQGKTKLFYRLNSYVYNTGENTVESSSTYANFAEDISKKVTALVQKMHITN